MWKHKKGCITSSSNTKYRSITKEWTSPTKDSTGLAPELARHV